MTRPFWRRAWTSSLRHGPGSWAMPTSWLTRAGQRPEDPCIPGIYDGCLYRRLGPGLCRQVTLQSPRASPAVSPDCLDS